jgi:hypothetical protein
MIISKSERPQPSILLLSCPLITLLPRSSQRGFDPSLNVTRFLLLLILLFRGRISDDEFRSNEVLSDVSDEACDD